MTDFYEADKLFKPFLNGDSNGPPVLDLANSHTTEVTTSTTVFTPGASTYKIGVTSDVDIVVNPDGQTAVNDGTSIPVYADKLTDISVRPGVPVKALSLGGTATVECIPYKPHPRDVYKGPIALRPFRAYSKMTFAEAFKLVIRSTAPIHGAGAIRVSANAFQHVIHNAGTKSGVGGYRADAFVAQFGSAKGAGVGALASSARVLMRGSALGAGVAALKCDATVSTP